MPRVVSDAFLAKLPSGVQITEGESCLDYISSTLAKMHRFEINEILAQMKAFVYTHPEEAKILLEKHPQFAYALFQALLLNKIVDSSILHKMLAASAAGGGTRHEAPLSQSRQVSLLTTVTTPTPTQQPLPHHTRHPSSHMHPNSSQGTPQNQLMSQYPVHRMPPYPLPHTATTASPVPAVAHNPNPAQPIESTTDMANLNDAHKTMMLLVLNMTPEQISSMPEEQRNAIMQLRAQFMPGHTLQ